jgi:hypothetical protein
MSSWPEPVFDLRFRTVANQAGAEGCLNVLDSKLAIQWPLGVALLTERDGSNPMLTNEFVGFPEAQAYAKHY